MIKLWHSGVILSAAGLLAGLGNYAFQAIIGPCLDKAEYGYVNSTLAFIGLLGLPLAVASTSVTHYIAHFRATGDEARLNGLVSGCRTFLFRLTLLGSGPVSPWNLEFAQYLAVGTASAVGGYCFTQGDLLVAQRNFSGRDLGLLHCRRAAGKCAADGRGPDVDGAIHLSHRPPVG